MEVNVIGSQSAMSHQKYPEATTSLLKISDGVYIGTPRFVTP